MNGSRSSRLGATLAALLCAIALAYPAAAAAAGCVGDSAVLNAWLGIAAQSGRLSAAQSAAAGRADFVQLAAVTRKSIAYTRASEAKLRALHPGTIQGRTMQSIALRFLTQLQEPSEFTIAIRAACD